MLSWEKLPQLMWDRKWHVSQDAEHNDSPLISFIDMDVHCFSGNMFCVSGYSYKWCRFPHSMTSAPYLQHKPQHSFLSAQHTESRHGDTDSGKIKENFGIWYMCFDLKVLLGPSPGPAFDVNNEVTSQQLSTWNRLWTLFSSWQQRFVCKWYFQFGNSHF